jgi:hypothetical protein
LTFSIRLESGMVHAGDMIIFDEKQPEPRPVVTAAS